MGRIALILLCLALKVSPSAQGFDFSDVQALARARAAQPYQASTNRVPPVLTDLKYEQYQGIRFKPSQALWLSNALLFYIEFFHCGHFHRESVQIHEVVEKQIEAVPFKESYFDYGTNRFELPSDLGFAGFRVVHNGKSPQETAVFLDASYFRMVGTRQDYGTSARGLALDTIEAPKEEFPVFQQFWLCRPKKGDDSLTVYALMDSPAVAGAYRFKIKPGTDTVAQVSAYLVQRHGVRKFGVAPLSSMFLHGKNGRPLWHDFRPEVHDADGLLIHNSKGEWIWHPLEAGKMMRVNAFSDENPKGFGLIQRERNFEQYQDLFAHFQNRPSVWIRTKGTWGKGAVELVQLNSAIEFTDNVVAYWLPRKLPAPGTPISFDYDIQWTLTDPSTVQTGKVIASRVSRVPDTKNLRFVVDFGGRDMEALTAKEQLALDLKFSDHVKFVSDSVFKNRFNDTWRVVVEVVEPDNAADFKIFLKRREKQITETWTYTWQP